MHTNYQPRKPGLVDLQVQLAKSIRKTLGGMPLFDYDELKAERQRKGLRYSDQGDFTRCYRGGF